MKHLSSRYNVSFFQSFLFLFIFIPLIQSRANNRLLIRSISSPKWNLKDMSREMRSGEWDAFNKKTRRTHMKSLWEPMKSFTWWSRAVVRWKISNFTKNNRQMKKSDVCKLIHFSSIFPKIYFLIISSSFFLTRSFDLSWEISCDKKKIYINFFPSLLHFSSANFRYAAGIKWRVSRAGKEEKCFSFSARWRKIPNSIELRFDVNGKNPNFVMSRTLLVFSVSTNHFSRKAASQHQSESRFEGEKREKQNTIMPPPLHAL